MHLIWHPHWQGKPRHQRSLFRDLARVLARFLDMQEDLMVGQHSPEPQTRPLSSQTTFMSSTSCQGKLHDHTIASIESQNFDEKFGLDGLRLRWPAAYLPALDPSLWAGTILDRNKAWLVYWRLPPSSSRTSPPEAGLSKPQALDPRP